MQDKYTKAARGQECLVRLPGICNRDPATVVFAHLRMSPYSGTAYKTGNIFGAFCCSACHDEIDRRTRKLESDFVRMAHFEGIVRTQHKLIEMDILKL